VLRVLALDEERDPNAEVVETEPERLDPSMFGLLYEQHRLAVYRYLRARTRSE